MKYKIRLIIFLVIALGSIVFMPAKANASSPDAFPLPKLTGNMLEDIINVSKSQVGYEGTYNRDKTEKYSVYGDWADQHGRSWCSEFVAWCANKAGIPETIIPKGLSSKKYVQFYYPKGTYFLFDETAAHAESCAVCKGNKTIGYSDVKPGDIIVQETNGNWTDGPDHTVLCVKVENGIVYTVEGNYGNSVALTKMRSDDIHGVCRPNYNGAADPEADGIFITDAIVILEKDSYEYTGKPICPKVVSVTFDGKKLVEGTDYKITYSNRLVKGFDVLKIVGIGKYTDYKDVPYRISCYHRAKNYPQSSKTYHKVVCSICNEILDTDEKHDYCAEEGKPADTCCKCGYKNDSVKQNDTTTDTTQIRSFVNRLYQILLDRNAESAGLDDWTNRLASGSANAAQIVEGIVNSQEFANKNLSNADVVERMYQSMLGRASDPDGKSGWTTKLNSGLSANSIINGFSGSAEFGALCANYGISAGSITLSEPRDQNEGISAFVARCYEKALGRAFEKDGLNYWCTNILNDANKKQKAEEVASNGFFHSQEFENKNTSNDEYVEILYSTFLGREYDVAGKADWVGKLNSGVSRDDVLYGFSRSQEFANIMDQYGL